MKRFTAIVLVCFIASSHSYAVNLGKLVDEATSLISTNNRYEGSGKNPMK